MISEDTSITAIAPEAKVGNVVKDPWEASVSTLSGVGSVVADKLAGIGIHCLRDCWLHLPLRFENRSQLTPISNLQAGQPAYVQGNVIGANVLLGRKRRLVVEIADASGHMQLVFFHFSNTQKNAYQPGRLLRAYGDIRFGSTMPNIVHPAVDWITDEDAPLSKALVPIYPTVSGISQKKWQSIFAQLMKRLSSNDLNDPLPEAIRQRWKLVDWSQALASLHSPPVTLTQAQWEQGATPGHQRLIFEELLVHHLSLLRRRRHIRRRRSTACPTNPLMEAFKAALPFDLTAAQSRVVGELSQDLNSTTPMQRLMQGDVGSGKTVVAALAALQVAASGVQVALMAPTEILAEQHYNNFVQWLEPLGISVGWISGSVRGAKRAAVLERVAFGQCQIVVGTHVLFEPDVTFQHLSLLIVDEQHRFGVHQRLALKEKTPEGYSPHQLIMTATPIPRTLAMSVYADLDTSVIDEKPPGRQPVHTIVLNETKRAQLIDRVKNVIESGNQVYWVCPAIEESEVMPLQSITSVTETLQEQLSNYRLSVLHGRLHAQEKAEIMRGFKAGESDVLVATTVIEVGVDVPNATLMIIENPERFGLAQLHQLRGRVGRGGGNSFCVLLYQSPLSQVARKRLDVMRDTEDGFEIAEQDLAIRGPGEMLGVKQTGEVGFKVADLQRDQEWIPSVKDAAQWLQDHTPATIDILVAAWLKRNERYAEV